MTPEQLAEFERDLGQFIGSEEFYSLRPIFPGIIITQGVKFVIERAGGHWLVMAIASHLVTNLGQKRSAREYGLLFWKLKQLPNGSWLLTGRTDGAPYGKEVARQEIPYSDFPLSSFDIWSGVNENGWTLYLPSEH